MLRGLAAWDGMRQMLEGSEAECDSSCACGTHPFRAGHPRMIVVKDGTHRDVECLWVYGFDGILAKAYSPRNFLSRDECNALAMTDEASVYWFDFGYLASGQANIFLFLNSQLPDQLIRFGVSSEKAVVRLDFGEECSLARIATVEGAQVVLQSQEVSPEVIEQLLVLAVNFSWSELKPEVEGIRSHDNIRVAQLAKWACERLGK
jgi:hypothetical protein